MQHLPGYRANDRYNHRSVNEKDMAELTRKLLFPIEDTLRAVQEAGSKKEAVEE
jgi:hypothetical protein